MKYIKYFAGLTWTAFFIFWVVSLVLDSPTLSNNFSDTYTVVPFIGSLLGFFVSRHWGGLKSLLGRASMMFAIGLFLQSLGQLSYSIAYLVSGEEIAFPSFGDVFFLATSIAYIYGSYLMLKIVKPFGNVFSPAWLTLVSILITFIVLCAMWFGFISQGIQDERGGLVSVLNVLYPLAQACYFLIGVVALIQSRRLGGGKMFVPIVLLLSSLCVQFAAEFYFLYSSYHSEWSAGGYSEGMYLFSYGLMIVAIAYLDTTRKKISGAAS